MAEEISQPTVDVYASWKSTLQELAEARRQIEQLEAAVRGAFKHGTFWHDSNCENGECTCGYEAWLWAIPEAFTRD